MSALGIAAWATALALLAALLAVVAARLARRRLREVERDAWWVLQVADTINADVRHATDVLWTLNHPDVWLLLVGERGWTAQQWERWFADTSIAQLLAPADP